MILIIVYNNIFNLNSTVEVMFGERAIINVVKWCGRYLEILNQAELPYKEEYIKLYTPLDVAAAIKEMKVRGAPLIGIVAAYGLALAKPNEIEDAIHILQNTRPTAFNLFFAINRLKESIKNTPFDKIQDRLIEEAQRLHKEEIDRCEALSNNGLSLIKDNTGILTLCNTGVLATGGLGTALGIIYKAYWMRKGVRIYACETRPRLQGAKLTIYELRKAKVEDVVLICDSMAGWLMQQGKIKAVIIGADRISANGDTANKIGSYNLAVLAHYHNLPFYVAAPTSTIDTSINHGKEILIEERDPQEVRKIHDYFITLEDTHVLNPAFDITPASLISAIITENRIYKYPYSFSTT